VKIVYFNYLGKISCLSIGPFVHIREFVNAVINLGNEVIVFPPLRLVVSSALPKVRWISKYSKQFKSLLLNIKYFLNEYSIVDREKPDVILVRYQLFHFSSIVVSKIKHIPLILEVNAPMAYEIKRFQKEFFYFPILPDLTEKIIFKLADAIVVVSNELKKYLVEQGIEYSKIYVVPNGVDVNKFKHYDKKEELLVKFGLKKDDVVIGFIGSFSHWHGLGIFFDSFERILKENENAIFMLIGDGFDRSLLRKKIEKKSLKNRVIFTGLVSHRAIPDYLSIIDIVIAPYPELEMFYFSPLKIFEYMAAAKPVVASRIGQISEIIVDGQNGFLFDSGDIDVFINILNRLIKDRKLRKMIGIKARQTVCEKYTWEINARRIAQICNNLIKSGM